MPTRYDPPAKRGGHGKMTAREMVDYHRDEATRTILNSAVNDNIHDFVDRRRAAEQRVQRAKRIAAGVGTRHMRRKP